ncbi:MAG: 1,4-alpha-glucan branching protein GlgB [Ruminococcaceae bacterium]|nr:1,4-alpha-glucan branching protein GlgB [Oscillospiraceae bacterium]
MHKLANLKADPEIYSFKRGTNYDSWKFLGGRLCEVGGQAGALFRVWAPHARAVSVVGDFNSWMPGAHPMQNVSKTGVWQCFIPGLEAYDIYKYCVTTPADEMIFKADPYAFHTETRPANCSKLYALDGYRWGDAKWERQKHKTNPVFGPLNIYELHAGSWRVHDDGNPYSYRDLADAIIPYVLEMGYTHIELMPLTEYPFDGSWGYQVTGYFAPTSRYGTPQDFMYLVDQCHQAGIGVIMDWVPAHFPKDEFGLYQFDGTNCYEDPNPHRAQHREWGTMVFDYGKPEVQCFLISSALFWLNVYHVDGLRFDAVASMLYLNYKRNDGEWEPNTRGGVENLEAIDLLRKLNTAAFKRNPGIMMIAEESTDWPLVSAPVYSGGLGFNFKWNMGWMNDMLDYMRVDPLFRAGSHRKVTFSFFYAFSENFILPISHDEVVHLKGSLIGKMPGNYDEKFAEMRVFLGYMMAHPGKKLLFMGQEFGQFREWSEARQLDWMLLDYDSHRQLQAWAKTLNHFYKDNPILWQRDYTWEGFQWVVPDDAAQNIVVFLRRDADGNGLVVCCNFAPVKREGYRFGVPVAGRYREVLSSDEAAFGGGGHQNGVVQSRAGEMHGFEQYISVTLPPLSAVFLRVPKKRAAAGGTAKTKTATPKARTPKAGLPAAKPRSPQK